MSKEPRSTKASQSHRRARSSEAEFSKSKRFRRRGRRNRFTTQASRESEVDRIIALMTSGMKVADIADAMKMSIATVYRRIDSTKEYVRDVPAIDRAAQETRAAQILALLHADVARAHLALGHLDAARLAIELESTFGRDSHRANADGSCEFICCAIADLDSRSVSLEGSRMWRGSTFRAKLMAR